MSSHHCGKSILLDTNALSALYLYTDTCLKLNIDINILHEDEIRESILNSSEDIYSRGSIAVDQIVKGFSIYRYLRDLNEEYDYKNQFLVSKLSFFELSRICLEVKYHEYLSNCNIPFRIRERNPFKFGKCIDVLGKLYVSGVHEHLDKTQMCLNENDIELKIPEEEAHVMDETIDTIAKIISHFIHLQSHDLYLYALAIQQRVDEIYSHDNELVDLANKINTGNDPYTAIRDNLTDALRQIPKFSEEYELSNRKRLMFPKGVKKYNYCLRRSIVNQNVESHASTV